MKRSLFPKKSTLDVLISKRQSLFKKRMASKISKRDVSVFGGPGSGRYPKGSGENPQASKRGTSNGYMNSLSDYDKKRAIENNVTFTKPKQNDIGDSAILDVCEKINSEENRMKYWGNKKFTQKDYDELFAVGGKIFANYDDLDTSFRLSNAKVTEDKKGNTYTTYTIDQIYQNDKKVYDGKMTFTLKS